MTKIRYGITGEISRDFPADYTVGNLLSDHSILGSLGAPENVVALSFGETLSSTALVADYSSITLEKKASSKAYSS